MSACVDDFIGVEKVRLMEGTDNYPVSFEFIAAPSVSGKGSIPYNTEIEEADVTVYDAAGLDVSVAVVESVVVSGGLVVIASFDYTALAAKGKCKVIISVTLDSGAVLPFYWDGLEIR